jgi:hypothetical protein
VTGSSPASSAGGAAPASWGTLGTAPLPRGAHVTAGRVVAGVFLMGVWFAVFAYLPYRVYALLNAHGLTTPISPLDALEVGTALAIAVGVAHIAKPTSAWGPAVVASSVVALVYLGLLLLRPEFTVDFGSYATFALEYRSVLLILAVAPALRLVSGAVVLVEDLARPGERVRRQFA